MRFAPGTIHLHGWTESEWYKQFVAEQFVTTRTKRGFQKLEWQKLRERNEALDCRVYARAAVWIAGADRWPVRKWAEVERKLGVKAAAPIKTMETSRHYAPAREAAERPAQRQLGRNDWLGGRQRNWFSR